MASSDYVSLYGVTAKWEPYTGGSFQDMEDFGAIDEVTLNVTEEDIKHISRACGSVGLPDKVALASTEILMDIISPEISPKMLAKAFRGTLTETDESAGTATEDEIAVAALGEYYNLTKRAITPSSVTCWDTTGGTGVEYTEGTDFNIDYDLGIFVAVDGGAITAASSVFVTFDNAAYKDIHIAGFQSQAATGKMTLKVCAVEGLTYLYVFEKVTLKLSGSYSLISAEDFVTIPLQGTVLADDSITDSSKSKILNIYSGDTYDV